MLKVQIYKLNKLSKNVENVVQYGPYITAQSVTRNN